MFWSIRQHVMLNNKFNTNKKKKKNKTPTHSFVFKELLQLGLYRRNKEKKLTLRYLIENNNNKRTLSYNYYGILL